MKRNKIIYLYFTLVQSLIILIAYEYIYRYSEAHYSSFASSAIDMIPISIWVIIGIQFYISFYVLLQQKHTDK
ncbi:MAG: hypothetical protein COA82_02440 [Alkaliphilus sp.]|nr:MAG: hypothetical protein COA82_02440 [Alkaliphilus sp.]